MDMLWTYDPLRHGEFEMVICWCAGPCCSTSIFRRRASCVWQPLESESTKPLDPMQVYLVLVLHRYRGIPGIIKISQETEESHWSWEVNAVRKSVFPHFLSDFRSRKAWLSLKAFPQCSHRSCYTPWQKWATAMNLVRKHRFTFHRFTFSFRSVTRKCYYLRI